MLFLLADYERLTDHATWIAFYILRVMSTEYEVRTPTGNNIFRLVFISCFWKYELVAVADLVPVPLFTKGNNICKVFPLAHFQHSNFIEIIIYQLHKNHFAL